MIETNRPDAAKRFVVVDDHPLFREALKSALNASFAGAHIQEADSIEACRQTLLGETDIDLILLDLSLQSADGGFEGLVRLRKEFPFVPVLIVSGLDEPRVVHETLCLGASGFVPKAAGRATLADAILSVLSGKIYVPKPSAPPREQAAARRIDTVAEGISRLTPAQTRVLGMIRRGLLNREIAAELGIGESTVKAHVSEIIRKLGVISRTQIVIETARNDLVAAQTERGAC